MSVLTEPKFLQDGYGIARQLEKETHECEQMKAILPVCKVFSQQFVEYTSKGSVKERVQYC